MINGVNYLITTAGHSPFEPETDTRLRTIMNELPMTLAETVPRKPPRGGRVAFSRLIGLDRHRCKRQRDGIRRRSG